ncbi:MAG: heme anaerobic degradation radical SAM methyltransferase ChuW/HutW [Candidatus Adiutrix sp.]|jgi:oxygen-independent coproporphyrinogen-3 oxidase|nr:heme anaerobic degradation radical SAM methyltransferase ChuW/HutW [Candidatus Adiutrix sp.]
MNDSRPQTVKPPQPAAPALAAPEARDFLARATGDPLGEAFDRKFTVHAGMPPGRQMNPDDRAPAYEKLLAGHPAGPLGLYLHIPFCHNQCLYCGFGGRRPERELCRAYVEALIAEMRWLKERRPSFGPLQVVYFGGGTPTLLEPELLDRLADELRRNFDLANDCELTLEGRLHDFSPERADRFLKAGFNRFSIGVQSFDTELRRRLGRLSERAKVLDYLGRLVSRQKAAVIIDLIYGLPGQSPDDFVGDLVQAEAVGVDGLDTYQLNIFPGSLLDQALKAGRLPEAAPLSGQGRFYRRASEHLLGRRWRQLSLSHFSRGPRERNIYNPWAKRQADCLALGAGAGGFLAGWSFYRPPLLENYLEKAGQNDFTPDILSPPRPAGRLTSFIVGQMEQGYLHYRRLAEDFGVDQGLLEPLLVNWAANELIELDGGWLTMTVNGRFWGVNLTQAVVETAGRNFKEN